MTFFFINSKHLWKYIFSDISTDLLNKQKEPFADVLQKRYSYKFHNNHRKTSVLESLFNKVVDLKASSFIKKRLQHRRFHVNILEKFLRIAFFIKHLQWLLLNKVKINLKSTWFILLPDWLYYVIKSIKTLNSKQSAKLERARTQRNRNMKN